MEALFAETPLKDMDPSALALAITSKVGGIPTISTPAVVEAIEAASWLHLYQTRANRAGLPRTPYVEHCYRNALRALRWGVISEPVIVAIILHDTVEDCLDRILDRFVPGRPEAHGLEARRDLAYGWMEYRFGAATARIVAALTNPVTEPAAAPVPRELKHAAYARNVEKKIAGDAEVFIGKFTDFMDNAGGLHHNAVAGNEAMVGRLAAKYLPVADVFAAEFAANPAIRDVVDEGGYREIAEKLASVKARLEGLVLQYA